MGGADITRTSPSTAQPLRIASPTFPHGGPPDENGDLPRNGLRSPYTINQTDIALRRRFDLTERVKLDVRVEYFNLFNHPMFGLPGSQCNPHPIWSYDGITPNPCFGKICPGSTTNLEAGGGHGGSGQSPLYGLGGPRSAQFTLKLLF
jgi:hypothetical protein